MKFSKEVLAEFPVIFYEVMRAMAAEVPYDVSQRYRDMEFELVDEKLVFSDNYKQKYHSKKEEV
jgi:hypothetical protein